MLVREEGSDRINGKDSSNGRDGGDRFKGKGSHRGGGKVQRKRVIQQGVTPVVRERTKKGSN